MPTPGAPLTNTASKPLIKLACQAWPSTSSSARRPINDVADILGDPHTRARGLVGSFDYPEVGEFKALKLPYRFLGWDDPQIGAPPTLGADTDRILSERLGYSKEKIAALREAKAI